MADLAGRMAGGSLPAVAQRLDERGESWRRLASARIIKMIALPVRRPFFEHAIQPTLGGMRESNLLWHVGQPKAVDGRFENIVDVVEDELAVDPDFDFPTFVLELPRPQAAI